MFPQIERPTTEHTGAYKLKESRDHPLAISNYTNIYERYECYLDYFVTYAYSTDMRPLDLCQFRKYQHQYTNGDPKEVPMFDMAHKVMHGRTTTYGASLIIIDRRSKCKDS